MLGTTRAEYLFVRLSIAALRSITPFSFAYVAAWIVLWIIRDGHARLPPYWDGKPPLPPIWTLLWPLLECAFSMALNLLWNPKLQQAAVHPPLRPRVERERLFEQCHTHIPDIRAYTRVWYLGAESKELRRGDVENWILWAIFASARLEPEWTDELDSYVRRIEELVGHKFPEGRNPNVRSIRLTLDDVEILHRPLLWYFIVMFVDAITYISMCSIGFVHYAPAYSSISSFPPRPLVALLSKRSAVDLPYWVRPHYSTSKKPVLFLHGIGIGLWPYVPFFRDLLAREPDVGIICVEFLPISMRIGPQMPDQQEVVSALHAIMPDQAVVVAHSFGTVVAAHLLRANPRRMAGISLVDPIPLLLHLPGTAHNFVYRRPGAWRANERQLWYFASRDPGIAHTLGRRFFWGENILWKDDLAGLSTSVVLSERDQIIPAAEVWQYLTGGEADWTDVNALLSWTSPSEQLDVRFFKGIDHAQVFDTRERRAVLLDKVVNLVEDRLATL